MPKNNFRRCGYQIYPALRETRFPEMARKLRHRLHRLPIRCRITQMHIHLSQRNYQLHLPSFVNNPPGGLIHGLDSARNLPEVGFTSENPNSTNVKFLAIILLFGKGQNRSSQILLPIPAIFAIFMPEAKYSPVAAPLSREKTIL